MKKPVTVPESSVFDPDCRRCERLARYLDDAKRGYPNYHCRPVGPFGDPEAALLIVGLAPGMHGANASGRPFTGDWCGPLLFSSLHRFGLANQPHGLSSDDSLKLINCRISNAVKCAPPQNKPNLDEIRRCNGFLAAELAVSSNNVRAILALGTVAHQAVIEAVGERVRTFPFGHAKQHTLPTGQVLFDSYHVSRYNTQTGRLTEAMFHGVLAEICKLIA